MTDYCITKIIKRWFAPFYNSKTNSITSKLQVFAGVNCGETWKHWSEPLHFWILQAAIGNVIWYILKLSFKKSTGPFDDIKLIFPTSLDVKLHITLESTVHLLCTHYLLKTRCYLYKKFFLQQQVIKRYTLKYNFSCTRLTTITRSTREVYHGCGLMAAHSRATPARGCGVGPRHPPSQKRRLKTKSRRILFRSGRYQCKVRQFIKLIKF